MCVTVIIKREEKEYLTVMGKNLGIKVLREREFTELQKTNEEKMQAPGGPPDPEPLAAEHPVVKGPGCLGIHGELGTGVNQRPCMD